MIMEQWNPMLSFMLIQILWYVDSGDIVEIWITGFDIYTFIRTFTDAGKYQYTSTTVELLSKTKQMICISSPVLFAS